MELLAKVVEILHRLIWRSSFSYDFFFLFWNFRTNCKNFFLLFCPVLFRGINCRAHEKKITEKKNGSFARDENKKIFKWR